ncbi:porin [Veronia pacifica]|uniref:Porin domain-containing protein n=1 Tax=Veronia pacifica TaxID=1080227 RepID=A0A1C3ERF9_9GAMM|nr:porin [Veronia pacifica]ODA35804.1 hypothetical protein A8L45_01840 [Veronia pacifica]
MKKTILAMAVPALMVAGAANAGVDLYDADGVNVSASGAMEVQYNKSTNDKSKAQVRLDDGDLALNTSVEISDSLKAVGEMAFKFEKEDVQNDRLYVGLSGDFGTFTVGRQATILDDAGVGKDIEAGGGLDLGERTDLYGDQVVKYTFDNDMFYAGIAADLVEDGKDGADEDKYMDGRIGARFEGLDARVYFADGEIQKYTDKDGVEVPKTDVRVIVLEAEYALDDIGIAAGYGQAELKTSGGKVKAKLLQLAADYSMNDTTFAVGVDRVDFDKGDAEQTSIYANVTQQLHSNVKVYAEVGNADEKDKDGKDVDTELGYTVGMEVKF